MGDMAASGAYYIAAACDRIVANSGSLTGSIGVIAEIPDASGLIKKVGLNLQTVKAATSQNTWLHESSFKQSGKSVFTGNYR